MRKTKNKPVIMIDFGGVYFTRAGPAVLRIFSKKFGMPAKKIQQALMGPNWEAHATGKLDEERYWKYVSDNLGISEKRTRQLRNALYNYSTFNEGMKPLVKKLRKRYRVAALSSIIIGWVEALEKKYKISNHFHEHHYTYDHGVDKPSEKFFLSAAKKMKVKPEDCIVIDDNRSFLAAVKKTGAKTILFRNAKQLERDLKKMGVEA